MLPKHYELCRLLLPEVGHQIICGRYKENKSIKRLFNFRNWLILPQLVNQYE